jgi:hypothetical protein
MRTTSTAVVRALNDEDVEGLLAVGAPGDEYEAEARLIAEALERLPDTDFVVDRVMATVADVCNRMFGPFNEDELRTRSPVYRRVAERIVGGT